MVTPDGVMCAMLTGRWDAKAPK